MIVIRLLAILVIAAVVFLFAFTFKDIVRYMKMRSM